MTCSMGLIARQYSMGHRPVVDMPMDTKSQADDARAGRRPPLGWQAAERAARAARGMATVVVPFSGHTCRWWPPAARGGGGGGALLKISAPSPHMRDRTCRAPLAGPHVPGRSCEAARGGRHHAR